ncbi:DUF6163 family protein [Rhizobiaceae bacterium n13]|uniref:DUF6163 family protein n=1 Tax=Ferirhizobium litorale TaxID=2927786 RepID=A0AAE3QC46_9HYPH|nr:DUF6163 family protein [Fererhizobium litorale]MDI7861033.1 DUF6163 family protein [Fererhizobium litorale]MDI7921180.1 DUF6163 family protein [Fererhizobium litorale]
MENDSPAVPKRTLTEILFVTFLRLVALSCFWFGLQYWAMLVGYSQNGHTRFDLLDLPWKVASTGLAVVYPVAALGLWLTVSWGPVLWIAAAGSQVLMYLVWPDIFGHNPYVVPMHAGVAVLYIAFRLALWREKRKQAERVRVDLP